MCVCVCLCYTDLLAETHCQERSGQINHDVFLCDKCVFSVCVECQVFGKVRDVKKIAGNVPLTYNASGSSDDDLWRHGGLGFIIGVLWMVEEQYT